MIRGPEFEKAIAFWNEAGSVPYVLRGPGQIASCLEGLGLVEPGVVSCPLRRPGPSIAGGDREVDEFRAVGREP